MEKDFLTALSLLKSKDKKIYDKEMILFDQKETEEENEVKKKSSKEKPFYLKDLEREMILKQ